MTPSEFSNAMIGWEEEKKESMELQRMLALGQMQVHVKKRLKVTDLCTFYWERSETGKARVLSGDEKEAFLQRIKERNEHSGFKR